MWFTKSTNAVEQISQIIVLGLILIRPAFGADVPQVPSVPQVRWAIISTDASADTLADLLVARLSEWDQVALVERGQIRDVLGELKLNASGLADSDQALRFGQLAHADALVLISLADANLGLRVRLVETQSSVRFLDTALPTTDLEKEVGRICEELKTAFVKEVVPLGDRRLIGVAPIKSGEPGDYLRPFCRSLTALVEFELQRIPQFIVLERSDLQRLAKESRLSGLELQIQGATSLLEVAVRRLDGGGGMVASCRLVTPGKEAREFEVPVNSNDATALRTAMVEAVVSELGADGTVERSKITPKAEALVFDQRYNWFKRARCHLDAAEMAEAALVLEPTQERFNAANSAYSLSLHEYQNRGAKHPQEKEIRQRMDELFGERIDYILTTGDSSAVLSALRSYVSRPVKNDQDTHKLFVADLRRRARADLQANWDRTANNPFQHFEVQTTKLNLLRDLVDTDQEFVQQLPVQFDEVVKAMDQAGIAIDIPRHSGIRFAAVLMDVLQVYYSKADLAKRSGVTLPDITTFLDRLATHENICYQLANLYGQFHCRDGRATQAALEALLILEKSDPAIRQSNPFGFSIKHHALKTIELSESRRVEGSEIEAAYIDAFLTRLTATNDITDLFENEQTSMFLRVLQKSDDSKAKALGESVLALLERSGKNSAAADLKHRIEDHLESRGLMIKAVMDDSPSPWKSFSAQPIKLTNVSSDNHSLMAVRVVNDGGADGAAQIILAWGRRFGNVSLERIGLNGGTPVKIAPDLKAMPRSFRDLPLAISPTAIFAAGESPGFTVVQKVSQSMRTFTQADGAPSDDVWQMAWFHDRLYIAFADSFAIFDPEKETFELLASSLSANPRNPIDGRGSFFIRSLIADERHDCLWMEIQDNSLNRDRNGVWRFDPRQNTYHRIDGSRAYLTDTKDRLYLYLSNPIPTWAYVDKTTNELVKLTQYVDNPNPHSFGSLRFIVMGDDIVTGAGILLTAAGQSHYYANNGVSWPWLQRYGDGFIAHYDEREKALYYFSRK